MYNFALNPAQEDQIICWCLALVAGEHISLNTLIYSLINSGQSKIYFNFTIKQIT